jgi:hypothetical protein
MCITGTGFKWLGQRGRSRSFPAIVVLPLGGCREILFYVSKLSKLELQLGFEAKAFSQTRV